MSIIIAAYRLHEALKAIKKAVNLNPLFDLGFYYEAFIYIKQKKMGNALASFKKSFKINPGRKKDLQQFIDKSKGMNKTTIEFLQKAMNE